MIDKLLKLSIQTLLAFITASFVLFLVSLLRHVSESLQSLWKLPLIVGLFLLLFVISFVFVRKILPFKEGSLIKHQFLSVVVTSLLWVCIIVVCIVPLFFSLFLLTGYIEYNRPYSERELSANASYIDLAKTDILNEFGGERLDLLERYFSSNKKWNVRHWKDRKVAFLRRKKENDWEISMNMYFTEPEHFHELQYRVGVYLGHEKPKNDLMHKSLKYASAGSKEFRVPMIKSGSPSTCPYESWLWVKGNGIGVEIFEQSKEAPRVYTRRFLREICEELTPLRDLGLDDSLDNLLVKGSFVNLPSMSFEIEEGFHRGAYEATGFVNIGKKGYVYIKAFDKKTSNRLSESRTKEKLEYPGWSSETNQQFYFRFEFTIYEGDWPEKYPAILELWFKPSDGLPERKLATKEMMISGTQR